MAGHRRIVELLLTRDADSEGRGGSGRTALIVASLNGEGALVSKLIRL
jgi:ankyrin repeat protein